MRASSNPFLRWLLMAACGDAAVIVLFAVLGRAAHGEHENGLLHTFQVAAPFLAGWFVSAAFLGAYRVSVLYSVRAAVRLTAVSWLAGGIIGLAIRSIGEGRLMPLSFAAVALSFVLVLLLIWRVALTTAFHRLRSPRTWDI